MSTNSVLIADGHFLVRKGLMQILNDQPDLKLCGEAEHIEELAMKVEQLKPQVVTVDISEPYFPVSEVLDIIASNPDSKFIVISASMGKQTILGCINAGVSGYLLKECDEAEIVDALRAASTNDKFFCRKVLDMVLETGDKLSKSFIESCEPIELSDRETEILKHIAEGFTNKEIADLLFLSTHTVNTHRKNIMHKLQITNTAGLVMYAVKENIISAN